MESTQSTVVPIKHTMLDALEFVKSQGYHTLLVVEKETKIKRYIAFWKDGERVYYLVNVSKLKNGEWDYIRGGCFVDVYDETSVLTFFHTLGIPLEDWLARLIASADYHDEYVRSCNQGSDPAPYYHEHSVKYEGALQIFKEWEESQRYDLFGWKLLSGTTKPTPVPINHTMLDALESVKSLGYHTLLVVEKETKIKRYIAFWKDGERVYFFENVSKLKNGKWNYIRGGCFVDGYNGVDLFTFIYTLGIPLEDWLAELIVAADDHDEYEKTSNPRGPSPRFPPYFPMYTVKYEGALPVFKEWADSQRYDLIGWGLV